MNICFVIGTLNYSGAEKIVRYLIEALISSNKISVMLLSCDSKVSNIPSEVNQYPLYVDPTTFKNPVVRVIKRIQAIRKVVKQNSFDIVVSFGVVFNMDVALAMAGLSTKLILCERNDPVHDPRRAVQRLRRRLTYPLADGYVFQTDTIKSFFSSKIQKRSTVIPNFIEKTVDAKDKYSPNRKAFATSARLDDNQKDQRTMIKAFSVFFKKHQDYVLELYGNGPDKELLQNYADVCGVTENVLFMGRVDNPMEHIKECKCFMLTSKYEGMPNSLIEAMAHGMPCIATDCSGGGAKALIKNEKNGILVPVGNVSEIYKAMERIVEDDVFTNSLSFEAYKINTTLEISKIITMWSSYFTSVFRGQNAQ